MQEYQWDKGRYLSDGHLWVMLLDIPKLPREDTGERVMLTPPPWFSRKGFVDIPPVECTIFYIPTANIYIAIGEEVNGHLDVLFFDKKTLLEEHSRRFPWPLEIE